MFFGALAALSLSFQYSSTTGPAAVSSNDALWLWIALGVGALALVAAGLLAKAVLAGDTGTPEMRVISDAIREGAEAFLARQYRTIGILAAVLAVVVFLGYYMSPRTQDVAVKTVISFLVGAICSGLAGFTGMYVSIRANIRTASAARTSLNKALQAALRGGAVTGLVVVALSLMGVAILFLAFGGLGDHPEKIPYQLVGFGFGASLVALFAQLGGGIYTKAADVGADLVGKVEAGIPEDDPRANMPEEAGRTRPVVILRLRYWRCWIPSRTSRSPTTTWSCRSTSPRCSSSARPTICPPSRRRCATGSR